MATLRISSTLRISFISSTSCTRKLRKNENQRFYWRLQSIPKLSPQTERWNDALIKAADLVEHNAHALNMADFLKLHDTSLAKFVGKAIATRHPLLKGSKRWVFETRLNFQVRGLIALLLAKSVAQKQQTANENGGISDKSDDIGIKDSQRSLADAIELYYTHFLTHSCLLNLNQDQTGEISKSLQSVNGMGVLWGDYLAANATCLLTSIQNAQVLGIISYGVIDFTETIFYGVVDKNGNAIPDQNSPKGAWEHRTFLEHASLLARGCQAMMILAGQSDEMQTKAWQFGRNIALAMKINQDIQDFHDISGYPTGTPFTMSLAPIILHLQDDLLFCRNILQGVKDDITNLDFEKIYRAVREGNGPKNAADLLNEYINEAENALKFMPSSEAVDILNEMLKSLRL